jgi:hypothetical protein
VLKALFAYQVERLPKSKIQSDGNAFIKLLGSKYISPTGTLDLLEDFGLMSKGNGCTCAGPCTVSCVSPCASRCNAATYDACSHAEL